jgi:hypothetical protein
MDNITLYEQETTINASSGDSVVRIWSAQPKVLRALRKAQAVGRPVTEDLSVRGPGGIYGSFTVPASEWSPLGGLKHRRELTDEQRQVMADRARARFSHGTQQDA